MSFILHVVEEFTSEHAAYVGERDWIAYLQTMKVCLYNKSCGGFGGQVRKTNDDVRRKLSLAMKGRVRLPERVPKFASTRINQCAKLMKVMQSSVVFHQRKLQQNKRDCQHRGFVNVVVESTRKHTEPNGDTQPS